MYGKIQLSVNRISIGCAIIHGVCVCVCESVLLSSAPVLFVVIFMICYLLLSVVISRWSTLFKTHTDLQNII